MLAGGSEGLTPSSRARFENCSSSKLASCSSMSLSFSVESIWCSVSNATSPPESGSARLRYGELRDGRWFLQPTKLPKDEHVACTSHRLFSKRTPELSRRF